jgi:hypothetical protein
MTSSDLLREAVLLGSGEWTTHRAVRLFRTMGFSVPDRSARSMLARLADDEVLIPMGDGSRRFYVKKEER